MSIPSNLDVQRDAGRRGVDGCLRCVNHGIVDSQRQSSGWIGDEAASIIAVTRASYSEELLNVSKRVLKKRPAPSTLPHATNANVRYTFNECVCARERVCVRARMSACVRMQPVPLVCVCVTHTHMTHTHTSADFFSA